eukprot:scaffold18904_cov112-Isochrysis_galbana.AAC.7
MLPALPPRPMAAQNSSALPYCTSRPSMKRHVPPAPPKAPAPSPAPLAASLPPGPAQLSSGGSSWHSANGLGRMASRSSPTGGKPAPSVCRATMRCRTSAELASSLSHQTVPLWIVAPESDASHMAASASVSRHPAASRCASTCSAITDRRPELPGAAAAASSAESVGAQGWSDAAKMEMRDSFSCINLRAVSASPVSSPSAAPSASPRGAAAWPPDAGPALAVDRTKGEAERLQFELDDGAGHALQEDVARAKAVEEGVDPAGAQQPREVLMEGVHLRIVLRIGVEEDGVERGVGQDGQHLLPPAVVHPHALSRAPPGRHHARVHLRMGLDDGVRAPVARLNGQVDDPETKPDVEHVAAGLAHLRGMQPHYRLLPLHHDRVSRLVEQRLAVGTVTLMHHRPAEVLVAIGVPLTGPALRRAQKELASRGMLHKLVDDRLVASVQGIIACAPAVPVECVPWRSGVQQQRDDRGVAGARSHHERGTTLLFLLVARLARASLQ